MSWDPAPGGHADWPSDRREGGGMDWGYLLVFVVIPMAIAWWLTRLTGRRVEHMWALDHPAGPARPHWPPTPDPGIIDPARRG